MANPFASIDTAINAACIGALANATATISGASVPGLWRHDYTDALNGMAAGAALIFDCLASAVPTIARGTAVSIDSVNYITVGIEPTGTGWVSLTLQKA